MISPTSPPQVALASPATEVASLPPPSLVVLSRPQLKIRIPKDPPTPADLMPRVHKPSDLPFGSPHPKAVQKASTHKDPRPVEELIRITQEYIKTNGI